MVLETFKFLGRDYERPMGCGELRLREKIEQQGKIKRQFTARKFEVSANS
jgi:hypothetical protein